jgi:hypothetical protein
MHTYILPAPMVPPTLYRVQHRYHPTPQSLTSPEGIYALNPTPSPPLTSEAFFDEVNNHVSIANAPRHGPLQSQWPSPFLSVFACREDAELYLRSLGDVPGEETWRLYEISGAEVAGRGGTVLRLRDLGDFASGKVLESEFLIWGFIPREAVAASWEWFDCGEYECWMGRDEGVLIHGAGEGGLARLRKTRFRLGVPAAWEMHSDEMEDESALPDGFYRIKAVIGHWPVRANIETAKLYKVRWQGNYKDEWCAAKDVTDIPIQDYWKDKQRPKKRRKTARFGRR